MIRCSSCAKENPEGFQFCGFCRAPLAEQLAISTARERKVVSVLFCDLVGFTAASEHADPEDVQTRIAEYHRRLRAELEKFGGTVEKFIGDAVMAVFGAPVAHEDDPERAVRAGLRILDLIEDLNAGESKRALQVRIGVNTGEAVVSLHVRPELGEGIVAGDVVNTAARIQAAAPVGGLAVGPETFRQTERVFVFEALPPETLKGKTEPVSLYRALQARGRFGTDVTRTHEAPFVGREADLGFLKLALAKTLHDSAPQLVTLVGEPGVGKSRLIAELSTYVDSRPELIWWRQGRCPAYGEGITFWALGELVKAHAGIYESDPPEVAESKLEAVLPTGEDQTWLKARMLPLLGIESGLAPERGESFKAWRRFVEGIAAAGPAVLVVEDLHWADPALVEFLAYLAEWAEGVPLLLVCTARPELFERHPGWASGMRNSTTISLAPLSDAETAKLICALTRRVVLSAELQRAILERAGGNPLYAEEFVRLLQDRRLGFDGTDEPAFPGTVQSLIAARLDTLNAQRKSLLQDAAVVGKAFWAGALAEMGNRDRAEVEQALHELSQKQLVHLVLASSMENETEYAFWHVLVRDVAYKQIPRGERATRHRAAAAWLEKAGERLEDLAELLAHHYLAALVLAGAAGERAQAEDLTVPARRFLLLAAGRALALDAARAETQLEQALALTPPGHGERSEILVRLADAAFHTGRPREAAARLEEALADLRARGATEATARALLIFSRVAIVLGEGQPVALAAEAVALLERQPPGPAVVDAYTQLAVSQFLAGNRGESVAAAERALALAAALELPEPARALGYRGLARALLDDRNGIVEIERAIALLVARGPSRDAAALQNNLALARYPLEGPAATLEAFEEGIAFCEQRGVAAMMLECSCPGLLAELGRPDQALARAARVATAAEGGGYTSALLEVRSVEVSIRAARGDAATTHAEWLVEAARTSGAADQIVVGLGAAAVAYAADAPDRASPLLSELQDAPGVLESPYYARQLPAMVRTALADDDPELARRLLGGLPPLFPLRQHALYAARAALAEAAGEHADAATYYAEAAGRWLQFGNVPERAHALLGQGRCLFAMNEPGAEGPLRAARGIFSALTYRPALAAVEAVLAQAAGARPYGE